MPRLKPLARRTAGALALWLGLLTLATPVLAAPWVQTTSLPDGYSAAALVYASGFLYHTGGSSESSGFYDGTNVFYGQVNTNGTIGTWNNGTPLPEITLYHASVAANGFVYVIGGYHYNDAAGIYISSNVYYAKINLDGSLGSWQTANPMPDTLDDQSASVWNNRIYVIGGQDYNSVLNTVYSATIQTNGSLSAWTTQAPLPEALFTQAEAANGFIYVVGGVNGGGGAVNTIYYTKINADGTLAGWNQTSALPRAVAEFGVVAANGLIFTFGGYDNVSPIITNSFYSAAVKGDGSLNSWSTGASLPQPESYFGFTASDSYIFVSGGNNGSTYLSSVYSMALPAPPAAPQFISRSFTNGNFQIQLAASTNTGFGLLASPDLINWTNIGWGFTGTNGLLNFQDTNAANFTRRFYRVYWPLP